MANHAYLRVWTRDFSLETMIAEFATTVAWLWGAVASVGSTGPVFAVAMR